ncbi:MAG: UDP-2,3-diacylglucosamine diphosphatase [Acidobacteriota bacterium]
MKGTEGSKPLIYVADSHLTSDDPEVDIFIDFLLAVGSTAGTLCILGDLFNVWFGERKFRMPHQDRVLSALSDLAQQGVVLKFVEGNRDFSIRRNHLGAPFTDVGLDCVVDEYGGRRIIGAHGDEVNRKDHQYLFLKKVSRNPAIYGLLRLLPGRWGIKVGESLERKLSGTNLRHKREFPLEECREYCEDMLAKMGDTIVLGHFHEQREVTFAGGKMFILPAWRDSHRYLLFEGNQDPRFVEFSP